MKVVDCPLCHILDNRPECLIQEFEETYWILGEHQVYPGYTLVVAKNHYKELTSAPSAVRLKIFQELLIVHEHIEKLYSPDKMNLHSLGNRVPHLHWHLFPRYKTEADFLDPVWLRVKSFQSHRLSPSETVEWVQKIQKKLKA